MILFAGTVILSALAGSVLACIPGLHVYNVMGGLVLLMAAAGHAAPPEILVAVATALISAYSVVSTVPAVLLAAPDESAFFTVLPGQKMLMQGRGYEAVMLTGMGSLLGLYTLIVLLAPVASRLLPAARRTLQPHFHWILWCVIAFMLLSEWPKGGRLGYSRWRRLLDAWKSPGMGLLVFVLSGLLGFLLFYRSPLPASSAFQNLMPAFVGLFTVPGLLLNMITAVRPPQQRETRPCGRFVAPLLEGSLAGALGGGFAAFIPAVTGGVGGMLAGHALAIRNDRAFLASQGAARAVYYVGGLLLLFVPDLHMTRGGAAWLLRPHFVPYSREHMLLFLAAAGIAGSIACLTMPGLARLTVRLAERAGYQLVSGAALVCAVTIVIVMTGPAGLLVLVGATAIGLLPPLFGTRRMNALGVILLPLACNMSGTGPHIAKLLGLLG